MSQDGPIQEQARVIYALILRDTRTRFGRTFGGFLVMILWPLSHALSLLAGYAVVHSVAPIGTDPSIFVATGVLPYILCIYPARESMPSLVLNSPLLSFPIVKPFDVLFARGILQIIVAFWVAFMFCLIMYLFNIEIMPRNPEEALLAILATIYLGFAIGFLGAILYKITRVWLAFQIAILIVMYLSGGIFFIPTALPQWLRDILWFNPMLHAIEWLRSAYFEGYGQGMLSREYLIGYSTVTLFLGLLAERGMRGKLQQAF
jgi:capsular polysaccharide transport system permease protein